MKNIEEESGASILEGEPMYPRKLCQRLGNDAPPRITLRGDGSLLMGPMHGVFCSGSPPPDLVLPALDLAREIAEDPGVAIGGFQSAVERLVLEVFLRHRKPVVICPARDIRGMRLPGDWARALEEGRLLLLSSVEHRRRADVGMAANRNRLVAALASEVSVVHAAPGGRVYRLIAEVLGWSTPVQCPAHDANVALLLLGATAWAWKSS
jgi:predicted Rossmann fold nucleotide-binding protein DprA/Smf involved in DNA uptake